MVQVGFLYLLIIFDIINLANLPIDPINKPPYYYTFVVGGSYEVTAYLEVDSNRNVNGPAGTDGGTSWNVYEAGNNKKLTPLVIEDGGGRDKSLVGYWPFDEGSGTIAYDASGHNNNGNIVVGSFINGKINYGLNNPQVRIFSHDLYPRKGSLSVVGWFYHRDYSYPKAFMPVGSPDLNQTWLYNWTWLLC